MFKGKNNQNHEKALCTSSQILLRNKIIIIIRDIFEYSKMNQNYTKISDSITNRPLIEFKVLLYFLNIFSSFVIYNNLFP